MLLEDYQVLLTLEEHEKFIEEFEELNEAFFKINSEDFGFSAVLEGAVDEAEWKNYFNHKVFNTSLNLRYVKKYYNKFDGKDIQSLEAKRNIGDTENHIWFDYECESLLIRFISLLDVIYQIINVKYSLHVKQKLGFGRNVCSALKEKNNVLSEYLIEHYEDDRNKEIITYRNNYAHNRSPLMRYNTSEEHSHEGFTSYSFKVKDYTKPAEMMRAIEEYLTWLIELVRVVKTHILIENG